MNFPSLLKVTVMLPVNLNIILCLLQIAEFVYCQYETKILTLAISQDNSTNFAPSSEGTFYKWVKIQVLVLFKSTLTNQNQF